jgi:hypothetical protein
MADAAWDDPVATWADPAFTWTGALYAPLFLGGPADERLEWGRSATAAERAEMAAGAAT